MFIATFFEHKTELPHKLSSFGFGFFIPIFFIYVGSTVNLNALFSLSVLREAVGIVAIILTLRIISSVVYLKKLGIKNTLMFAMGDSMPLTFLLAVATIAKEANAIAQTEYYALIIAGLIASVTMMTIIKIMANFNRKKI
jgi:Kef-type K+ transport system membrane component KefB